MILCFRFRKKKKERIIKIMVIHVTISFGILVW